MLVGGTSSLFFASKVLWISTPLWIPFMLAVGVTEWSMRVGSKISWQTLSDTQRFVTLTACSLTIQTSFLLHITGHRCSRLLEFFGYNFLAVLKALLALPCSCWNFPGYFQFCLRWAALTGVNDGGILSWQSSLWVMTLSNAKKRRPYGTMHLSITIISNELNKLVQVCLVLVIVVPRMCC